MYAIKKALKKGLGADERTRTSTVLPPLEPESSASTNSATSAKDVGKTWRKYRTNVIVRQ